MKLILNFYGVIVRISSDEERFENVINLLREDFGYFFGPSLMNEYSQESCIEVNLVNQIEEKFKKRHIYSFKNKSCKFYGLGSIRYCRYSGGSTVVSQRRGSLREFWITGKIVEEVYEVTYLALLSSIGEELDLLGYHRVHALGFTARDQSCIILLPSKGGKSSLAYLLSLDPETKFFSDEMPLLRKGKLFPFPIRFALDSKAIQLLKVDPSGLRIFMRMQYPPKFLIPMKLGQISNAKKLQYVLAGRSKASIAKIEAISSIEMGFNLFMSIVVGMGLCQMTEHMVRLDNIFRLMKIFTFRVLESINVFLESRKYIFQVTNDPNINKMVLEDFLRMQNLGNNKNYILNDLLKKSI